MANYKEGEMIKWYKARGQIMCGGCHGFAETMGIRDEKRGIQIAARVRKGGYYGVDGQFYCCRKCFTDSLTENPSVEKYLRDAR